MSFTIPPSPPARPNRCQLFGPGSRPELFPKMAASAADVINLDLEDSVPPADKAAARANIIKAIGEVDWGTKTLSVRINGLDTAFWYRDIVDILEQAGERIDLFMIPKVGTAADLYAVDALVTAVEAAKGRTKRSASRSSSRRRSASPTSREIAAGSPRLQAMSLGAADFAASMGMQTTGIGGTQDGYYMLPPSEEAERAARLRRSLARRHRRHRRRLPGERRAAGGRPVRRLLRPRRLHRPGAPLRDHGHGRQMGDPPDPGEARQRGVHAAGGQGRRGARDPRRHGRGRRPRARARSPTRAG